MSNKKLQMSWQPSDRLLPYKAFCQYDIITGQAIKLRTQKNKEIVNATLCTYYTHMMICLTFKVHFSNRLCDEIPIASNRHFLQGEDFTGSDHPP